MNTFYNFASKFILLLLLSSAAFAQNYSQGGYQPSKERGDPKYRTKGQMQGNNINTTIFNWGLTGRENGNFPFSVETPYEWPKNSGEVYLALTGILIGGEVTDSKGDLQHIIDVMDYRTSPQGTSWNFEPVPGYYNANRDPREIANSEDPTTWPDSWPDRIQDSIDPGWKGKWNGYFGKNIFNATQEIYYHAADNLYDRYINYFPDSTDLTRKGLGILLNVRVLAWSQVLVEDVLYILQYLKNDGTRNLGKVGVTIWWADFVGGNGAAQKNISEFDLKNAIAWSRDQDNRSTDFGNDPVGIVAVTFLETPGNAHDRIDNDGDGEANSPIVTQAMLNGEIPDNEIDDNNNGLVDENQTHIAFGTQKGFGYADGVDNNDNGEAGSPIVTAQMVQQAQTDKWLRWPPFPETDSIQLGKVHLIELNSADVGHAFKDNIDNNGNGEQGSPVITQAIIDQAAKDAPFFRYRVPNGKGIILYNVTQASLGKKYADGIDNDNYGDIDENIDENIDEMIDEARDNGIDDDHDWNILTDDVGLDGVPETHDFGEGDGRPTSGARFGLPGEPNIDVTDVHETDKIGITNAQYIAAGGLNINSDAQMWFDFMIPGKFYDPQLVHAGDYDLFVSSSFFPLKSGQTEPISLGVILANGPINDPGGNIRKSEILRKRIKAQETYNNDYQFANAPATPTLTAIPGNNRVTLYWDDKAESSFDRYLNNIGGEGHNFEGYKIYRSSDPAFADIDKITNALGGKQFKIALATFDLVDGIKGFDSVGVAGVKYFLGDDTGIQHSYVDTTVQNGFTYYYALVSYSKGFPAGQITPAESPIRVTALPDGTVRLGSNVARVTPSVPSAGYIPASLGQISHISGSSTGTVSYNIVDPNKVMDNHVYYITFQDTLRALKTGERGEDTLKTLNFTLIDSTANQILIDKSKNLSPAFEQPMTDGFRLSFTNETSVELNRDLSKWNKTNIPPFIFEKFLFESQTGEQRPNDYFVIFGPKGFGQSADFVLNTSEGPVSFPSKPVNFKVFNRTTQKFIDFGFMELDSTSFGSTSGELSAIGAIKDRIVFLEPNSTGQLVRTWWFYLDTAPDTAHGFRLPRDGDTATISLRKPFLSSDKFRFVASAGKINVAQAQSDLNSIQVVPNPYVATALWEPKNTFTSGRGTRSLHFTHLPAKCTIRIFTVSGELVDIIYHDSPISNGTEDWNMLTIDQLSLAYGVYIYHVDAPGIGEKVGKFAVIK